MRAKNKHSFKMSSGRMILFALPFAAVGVGMTVWLFLNIVASQRMKSWEETPARIVHVDLKVHHDDDSTTYEATAEYVYNYGGREYTSTRVTVSGGFDNIGSFQKDVHRQLSEHHKTGRPFHCFVNPSNPAEAVLFRDLRWQMIVFKMIFALAFGTAGFGLLTFGVITFCKQRTKKKLVAVHPDEPWLWRTDWADGRIVSLNKIQLAVTWVVAIFWNSISSSLIFFFFDQKNMDPLLYLFLLFPIVGAAMLVWAIISTVRLFKYGQSVFQMASTPGVIGGQLAGVIRVPVKVQPANGFRLTLTCLRKHDNHEDVQWQDEQVIVRQLHETDPERSTVPVLFNIPYECEQTGESPPITWWLEIVGDDYSSKFEAPVFKTPQSDPDFVPDRSAIEQYTLHKDPDEELRRSGVIKTASPFGAGSRFVFPRFRHPLSSLFLMLLWIVWTGVLVLMIYLEVPVIFPILFGLMDVVVFGIMLETTFYRSVVDVSPLGIEVSGGMFLHGRSKLIEKPNIEKIEAVYKGRIGNKTYFSIRLFRRKGKSVTLGKRVEGKRLANVVVDQIKQAVGDS